MTIHVSIPLEEDQIARIDEIAAARSETPAKVLAEVVSEYLEYDAAFRAAVQVGMDAAARGELHDLDEVERKFRLRTATINAQG